jgi:L-amino acid N-acyltransferase YncA
VSAGPAVGNRCRRWPRAEPNAADRPRGVPCHRLKRFGDRAFDSTSVHKQLFAGSGCDRTAPDAVYQTDTEPPFKLSDLKACRRLRDIEALCRRREASQFDDMTEGLKVIEAEAAHDKVSLMHCIIKPGFTYSRSSHTVPRNLLHPLGYLEHQMVFDGQSETRGTSERLPPGTRTGGVVRDLVESDMATVQSIYAFHVLHGLASFEEEPPSVDEMDHRRIDVQSRGLPYLAADMNGRVVGYSYAAPYRSRPAHRFTVENSVYVDRQFTGRGIGSLLLSGLISRCVEAGCHQMIAVIGDVDNAASIALHTRLGFRHVGTLHAVGFKFGRWVDSVLMQCELGTNSPRAEEQLDSPFNR